MARQNLTLLTGAVISPPMIHQDNETGQPTYGVCYIDVVRGPREVGDGKHSKNDNPVIMSREPSVLKEMSQWEKNDIVSIKGPVACRMIRKGAVCPSCGERNVFDGALVYVNPIHAMKIGHFDVLDDCIRFLSKHSEISNQVFLFGTLCRDPKMIRPKEGLVVTQYQIALNRKYRIRSDPPEIRADYPWVKSYGENAVSDHERLHVGSQVFVDGCLQARSVERHAVCCKCGESFDWKDRAMEIVPYETEYINGFYSDEEVEKNKMQVLDDKLRSSSLADLVWGADEGGDGEE